MVGIENQIILSGNRWNCATKQSRRKTIKILQARVDQEIMHLPVESWIIKWFSKNTTLAENEIIKNLDENYLIKGWIDSLKFISFITDIENEFKISFSNDEFQNRKFATILGLVKIIDEKINERL